MSKENLTPEVEGENIIDLQAAKDKKTIREELDKIERGENFIFPVSKLLEQILAKIRKKKS